LGVRWGVGHSTGLLLVGVVLIFLSLGSDADTVEVPDGVTKFFESLVGFFMVGLGIYGIRRAWGKRLKHLYGIVQEAPDANYDLEDDVEIPSISDSGHSHFDAHNSLPLHTNGVNHSSDLGDTGEMDDPASPERNRCCNLAQNVSTRTMALCAGIIHGLAGPGGVLGVIPAVQLHDLRLATIYLGCFCISSTLTMGVFAATYGTCSARLGQGTKREFQIELISASLSILVGITWLTLLSIGKLEDVFP
jgi:hypothetical protein